MNDPMIHAVNLHKSFGSTQAVRGVSLAVRAGEAYGLVGPDGAGKTTTIRMIAGVLAPDEGQVRLAGHDRRREASAARSQLGYLSQRFSLYSDLTVSENLRFFGAVREMRGAPLVARAAELLRFVGLNGVEGRLAGNLSGGMKQKLSLACALIHRPPLLLLDEPTGGVDPIARQDFWQLIIRLLGEGLAVVVSTPYMDEAVRCHRIGFLYQGQLLQQGTPQQLIGEFRGEVLELRAHPKRQARLIALRDPDVEDALPFGEHLHLRVREATGPLDRLPLALAAAGVQLQQLRRIPPTLEDVFISLLEAAERASTPLAASGVDERQPHAEALE